jgi:hypothetical protein
MRRNSQGLGGLIRIACIVAIAMTLACGTTSSDSPTETPMPVPDPALQSSFQDDIREAVFRYQFEHGWPLEFPPVAYFLAIEGRSRASDRDPDDAFMSRFDGHQPPTLKASLVTDRVIEGVTHRDTGERGLILRVTEITWITGAEVTVEGSIYQSGAGAEGHEYRVVLDGGRWTVVEDVPTWVS